MANTRTTKQPGAFEVLEDQPRQRKKPFKEQLQDFNEALENASESSDPRTKKLRILTEIPEDPLTTAPERPITGPSESRLPKLKMEIPEGRENLMILMVQQPTANQN